MPAYLNLTVRHLFWSKGAEKNYITETKLGNLWHIPCRMKDNALSAFIPAWLISSHTVTKSLEPVMPVLAHQVPVSYP